MGDVQAGWGWGDLGVVGWGDECAVNGGDRESPVSKNFSNSRHIVSFKVKCDAMNVLEKNSALVLVKHRTLRTVSRGNI